MSAGVGTTLPPEWDDDVRMNFMFSDFHDNRDVNPTAWDSKLDFWTALILRSCRDRRTVCVSLQELNQAFRRKERSPLGLPTVLRSLLRCGRIQRDSEFAVDCGWLSWAMGLLLVRPLKWTLASLLGSRQLPLQETFVVHELVKEKAAELLQAYRSSEFSRRSVLSFSEVSSLASDVCADESSLCMSLLQLQRDKKVLVALHEGKKIVKFSQGGPVSALNDVDVGIYQLHHSEKLLEEQVKKLDLEAERSKGEVRSLLREGKRSQALRCLRGCKRLEKRSDQLFSNLETIRGILDRISQSQTNKMVVQAYQAGVSALKEALKDVTVERAESLVDQIQELCDSQDDVNQTLSSGVSSSDADVEELEEELNSLLEESPPDSTSVLPPVPTAPLPLPLDSLLGALPAAPTGPVASSSSSQELLEQLGQLTLAPSGSKPTNAASPASKRLEPVQ